MLYRLDYNHFLASLMALLLLCICDPAISESPVASYSSSASIPDGRYFHSPYFRSSDGMMLLHLMPRDPGSPEILLDARTGQAANVSEMAFSNEFERLGLALGSDAKNAKSFDAKILRQLGCATASWHECTRPADADVVLFVNKISNGHVRMEVHDLQPLFKQLESVLSGKVLPATIIWNDRERGIIDAALLEPQRRAKALDLIRSIDSKEQFQNLVMAYSQGPVLGKVPAFGIDSQIDLKEEINRLSFRLKAKIFVSRWEKQPNADNLAPLLGVLLDSTKEGQRNDLNLYILDTLSDRPAEKIASLSRAISTAAHQRQSHVLWCYAQWVKAQSCGGNPPWRSADVSSERTEPKQVADPAKLKSRSNVIDGKNKYADKESLEIGGTGIALPIGSDSAEQELVKIRGLPNKLSLLSFSEESNRLTPESGAAGGWSFVARSLGALQEGRFEIKVFPNSKAPMRLAHGNYRVSTLLALDIVREQVCKKSAISCRFSFSDPVRVPKHIEKSVVFNLSRANNFSSTQVANFGQLLPLSVESEGRYEGVLKDLRLYITSNVRFELD